MLNKYLKLLTAFIVTIYFSCNNNTSTEPETNQILIIAGNNQSGAPYDTLKSLHIPVKVATYSGLNLPPCELKIS
jgi:hypothetical protein